MATCEWIGGALAVPDECKITIANTWATNDTVTITITGASLPARDLVITLGTPVTTADVAALIVSAFNATTRINDTTGSSNAGGQSLPEFAELIATQSGSVVYIKNRRTADYGKPFQAWLTVTESTAGSGTATLASVQAATGPNFFDNADNWKGGSVPADGDTAIFANSSVDCCYNMPKAATYTRALNIDVYNSYKGRIGLPAINANNTNATYYEYRPREFVSLGASGATTYTVRIGLGDGEGPKLVNIALLGSYASTSTFDIDCNGKPSANATEKVVNVRNVADTTKPAVLTVRRGSVAAGTPTAGGSWGTVNVAGRAGQLGDVDVSIFNVRTSTTVNQVGGRVQFEQDTTASWSGTVTINGGELIAVGLPPQTLSITDGVFGYTGPTGKTIATGTFYRNGALDLSASPNSLTFTDMNLYAGWKLIDPGKKLTQTNAAATFGKLSEVAANMDAGLNRTLKVA